MTVQPLVPRAAPRETYRRARRQAFTLAISTMVFCSLYIFCSSKLAERLFPSVEEVAAFEIMKGFVFVVVISLLLYAYVHRLLRENARRQEELLRSQSLLELADRRAMAGVLAAAIAHDMTNVLSVALISLDELRASNQNGTAPFNVLRLSYTELNALARRLATIGQEGMALHSAKLDLGTLARETHAFASLHRDLRGCQVFVVEEQPVSIEGYPRLLSHMLMNLLLNAGAATKRIGRVEVRIGPHPDGGALLEVHDDGPGIAASVRDHLFEPFATTKEGSLGLGLVSVQVAAREHGGTVEACASPLGGACFRVRLARTPVVPAA
jgi:signal transduction histidine kinase